ncbi:hypothetical protein SO694_00099051 [Aureococcus anophagefferens]|uniref:Uncharacterized protein n=1 Tax=Aureococcus anophagefferens TaxID=44056 RepID=A0ABR1FSL6_AURAN
MGAADVAVGSPPASPTAATQTQRTTRVTKGTAFDGAYYANHPRLLDRQRLMDDLRRLERKLYMASQRIVILERESGQREALEARTTRDRRVMMRLERSVFGVYAKILAALLQFEDKLAREKGATTAEPAVLYGAGQLEYARKAGDALRAMLAAVADPDGSPAAGRGDEPGRYVSDEGVKAYQAVGANLVARVDSAMSGEMRHELARIASKGDAPHESELEARVKTLEAENKLLRQKHQVAELKGLELRKRLDDVMAERYRDGQRSIDAEIEKREFRDAILELVMDLRDGIVKRLGFIPASTQAEINAFISTLADTEKADARAAVAAAAASLPAAPAKAPGPPPPPARA